MDDENILNLDFTVTEGWSSGPESSINFEDLPSNIKELLSQATNEIEMAIKKLEQAVESDLVKEPSWQMLAYLYLGTNQLDDFSSLNRRYEEAFGTPISVNVPQKGVQIVPERVVFEMPQKIVRGSLPNIILVQKACVSSRGAMLNFSNVNGADTNGLKELAEFFENLPLDETRPEISGIDRFISSLEKTANDTAGIQEMWSVLFAYRRFCNDADAFDELAIKFAVRFCISPPSW